MKRESVRLPAVLLIAAMAALAADNHIPIQNLYVSPDKTFQFAIGQDYRVYVGLDKPPGSYVPVCRDASLACALFVGHEFKGTNFSAASFEISLLKAADEGTCTSTRHIKGATGTRPLPAFNVDQKNPTKRIDGTSYYHSHIRAAAASTDVDSDEYRAFIRGKCYSLTERVAYGNLAAYDPNALKPFTANDRKRVDDSLTRMLDSFKVLR